MNLSIKSCLVSNHFTNPWFPLVTSMHGSTLSHKSKMATMPKCHIGYWKKIYLSLSPKSLWFSHRGIKTNKKYTTSEWIVVKGSNHIELKQKQKLSIITLNLAVKFASRNIKSRMKIDVFKYSITKRTPVLNITISISKS